MPLALIRSLSFNINQLIQKMHYQLAIDSVNLLSLIINTLNLININ